MSLMLKIVISQMKKQPPFAIGEGVDYEAQRRHTEDPKIQMPIAKGTRFTPLSLREIQMERVTPRTVRSENIIFYIHGGGMVTGNAFTSRPYASMLAEACGMEVYTISYRLAPEQKFPAATDDCFLAYQELLSRHPGKKIALVGESAGGNLVLVTALRTKESGLQLPSCVYSQSPCTNLYEPFPSIAANVTRDLVLGQEGLFEKLRLTYGTAETDFRDPHISPFFGDYAGFPPLLLTVDDSEMLYDDTCRVAEKARSSGVDVTCLVQHNTFHTFPIMAKMVPEAKKILKQSAQFLQKWNG